MSDLLPPVVMELRTDASQSKTEIKDYESTVKRAADNTEADTKRAGGAFRNIAGGVLVGQLAVQAFDKALEGLHKIVETGITESKDAAISNAQLSAGLKSTGDAANVTMDGLHNLAESIQAYSGQTDDSIAGAEQLLLTFTSIKNVGVDKVFDDATKTAADMAARLGGDASGQAILLGKALNDPIKGLTALTRVGVSFTQQQKDQIAQMVGSNDLIGAQKVILGELNKEFGGSAEAVGQTFPGAAQRAKRAFEDISQSVVDKFLPIVTPALIGMVNTLVAATPKVEAAAGRIAGGLAAAGHAVKDFAGGFKNGTDAIGSSQSVFASWGAAAYGAFSKVMDVARPIWDSIKDGVEKLIPIFAPIIGQVLQLASAFSPLQMIIKALAPVIPSLIDTFVKLAVSIGGTLGKAITQILPIVTKISGMLSGELSKIVVQLAPIVEKLAVSLGGLLGKALTAVMPLVMKLATFAGTLLEAVLPLIQPILDLVLAFLPLLDPIIKLVGALLPPLVDLLTMILDPVMQVVSALVKFLAPAIQTIVKGFGKDLIPIINGISEVLGGLIDFITGVFTGNWSKAWKGITEIATGIWDTVQNAARGAVNGIIDVINGIIAGIDGIADSVKTATGGAINIHIGKIPKLPAFDIGGRVPGSPGAPVPILAHGGEEVASNRMLAGDDDLPPRVMEAAQNQQARENGGRPAKAAPSVVIMAQTNATPQQIASAASWELRRRG